MVGFLGGISIPSHRRFSQKLAKNPPCSARQVVSPSTFGSSKADPSQSMAMELEIRMLSGRYATRLMGAAPNIFFVDIFWGRLIVLALFRVDEAF